MLELAGIKTVTDILFGLAGKRQDDGDRRRALEVAYQNLFVEIDANLALLAVLKLDERHPDGAGAYVALTPHLLTDAHSTALMLGLAMGVEGEQGGTGIWGRVLALPPASSETAEADDDLERSKLTLPQALRYVVSRTETLRALASLPTDMPLPTRINWRLRLRNLRDSELGLRLAIEARPSIVMMRGT